MNTHIVNEFNEVVPVKNGRISNNTGERRDLTDFEVELLEVIKYLKDDIKRLEEIEIFEMTHTGKNYSGYTPIQPITANSQQELKDKIDNYLEELMAYINEPLIECEHCRGLGYVNKIEKFEHPE